MLIANNYSAREAKRCLRFLAAVYSFVRNACDLNRWLEQCREKCLYIPRYSGKSRHSNLIQRNPEHAVGIKLHFPAAWHVDNARIKSHDVRGQPARFANAAGLKRHL